MSLKIRALIVISLLLNILFISIFTGHLLEAMRHPVIHPLPPIDASDFNLSEQELLLIQKQLHTAHLGNRATFELIQEEKDKALQILRNKPFDEAAYQARIDAIHKLRGQAVQHITDTVKRLTPTLNDYERLALAALLRNPPPPEPLSRW